MAKRTRMAAAVMAVAAILGTAQSSAAAESGAPAVGLPAEKAHLRSSSPVINAAIRSAIERSATFRDLVAEIDASDSWVFVNEGRCGHGVYACFASVRSAGSHRFLFVVVDSRKKSDRDLIASIGHELRHTIEVIREPSIRTDVDKYFFYEQIGMHLVGGERETLAARDAGDAVRSEVTSFNRQAKSE
jgi:hypothetical protein